MPLGILDQSIHYFVHSRREHLEFLTEYLEHWTRDTKNLRIPTQWRTPLTLCTRKSSNL